MLATLPDGCTEKCLPVAH